MRDTTERCLRRSPVPWRIASLLLAALSLAGCSGEPAPRFTASGYAVEAPPETAPYADTIREARRRIDAALEITQFRGDPSPFDGGYTREQVVAMRAPWERAPETGCEQTTGILFIHGLSDSPYTLRPVGEALAERFPCALLRGLLLPGHGTVPGDLISVHRQDFHEAVDHAVTTMLQRVDSLYLAGYSTGAALALAQADERRNEDRLDGLMLFSPALDLGNPLAWLTPALRHVTPWLDQA